MISSAAISGALAASAPPGSPAIPLAVQGVAFCQAGLIALGVLAVGTEYAGCQIVTTLATIPNRTLLLVGKATAYLIGAAAMAAAAIGAGLAAAWAILAGWGATAVDWGPVWPMVGAAVYLVAMGLLAFAVATLLRSLIAPLVGMSSLVFVVSPLLTGIGQYGHWLPDQAGALLYGQGDGTARTPVAGALVLAGWIAAVMLAAGVRFFRHDA
jgi:hypothetical protein